LSAIEEEPQTETGYPERGSALFYELAKDRLSTQLDTIDGIDAKLGMLFSVSSALIGILVAVFTIRGNTTALSVGDYTVISISGALYILAGGVTYVSYRARTWKIGPKLLQVWDDLHDPALDDDLIRWQAARAFWSDYDDNLSDQKKKSDRLPLLVLVVIVQVLALCSALGLVAAGG
jgi:hypothetical protein